MRYLDASNPNQFYVIGLSYKKTDAETRGIFSITPENQAILLSKAKDAGCEGAYLISTCNRTELYGFASDPSILFQLLVEHSSGDLSLLKKIAYVKKATDAINHLFKVGCGLDSQILGDFEVISQVRKSFEQSIKAKTTNVFMSRLVNAVIQASRKVKFETKLSTGVTSVSFAGVQFIRNQFENLSDQKILLYGTGKLGRNTCENLIKHSNHDSITLINRSIEKATKLGEKFDVLVKDVTQLKHEIANSDILFVSTGAPQPTITVDHIDSQKSLLILDLSIPRNVQPEVGELDNVTLIHMDELSQLTNKTLEDRKKYLPHAISVMTEIKMDFLDWVESRKMVPTINALNQMLKQYKDSELQKLSKSNTALNEEHLMLISDKMVRKLTGKFANYLRNNSQEFDKDLDLIHQIFELEEVQ